MMFTYKRAMRLHGETNSGRTLKILYGAGLLQANALLPELTEGGLITSTDSIPACSFKSAGHYKVLTAQWMF